ncbi:MAG: phosphoribosyl-AMP cyclohydrolase [Pseudomonadales bacterium]|nr:phosphoribosyl-AMP cyclohydrolase [Pseudomonadales bacterium]
MALLQELETQSSATSTPLVEVLDVLPYNEQGLIAAIAQDATSREVLMLAWMNREAIEATITQGVVTYFSRSRQALWRKGETSGHTQTLKAMHIDCDGDAILLTVQQSGPACHTNRPSCFYLCVQGEQVVIASEPVN